jgi:hypothetical protein
MSLVALTMLPFTLCAPIQLSLFLFELGLALLGELEEVHLVCRDVIDNLPSSYTPLSTAHSTRTAIVERILIRRVCPAIQLLHRLEKLLLYPYLLVGLEEPVATTAVIVRTFSKQKFLADVQVS